MSLGHALGIPFRRGVGAFEFDPEEDPSGLDLIVINDTEIDGGFIINALSYDGHEVWISTDGINYTLKITIVGTDNTFQATELTANTLYYFKIRAYRGAVFSDYSNIASATTDKLLVTDDFQAYNVGSMTDRVIG